MNDSIKSPLLPAARSFKAFSTNGAAANTAGWTIAMIGAAPGTNIPTIVAMVGSTFITPSTTFSVSVSIALRSVISTLLIKACQTTILQLHGGRLTQRSPHLQRGYTGGYLL